MAVFTGWILILISLVLAAGGGWLAMLGGSPYYLCAAAGLLLTGVLMVLRRPGALWIYALVILGTGLWAVWEVGLDWWALMPRGAVIVALGLWLITPWVTRGLNASGRQPWGLTAGPLTLMVAAAAGLALVAVLIPDRHGVRGELPTARTPQAAQAGQSAIADGDWHAYGRTGFGQRYSPLEQITPDNVDRLEKVWTYHTGDVRGDGDPVETTFEVTPLKIDDTLYLCTPHHQVVALDADTGTERWTFDPRLDKNISRQHQTCRGLSYFDGRRTTDGGAIRDDDQALAASGGSPDRNGGDNATANNDCARRLFLPTADARLIALDPDTGNRCQGFGDNGAVDLWANMPNREDGFYYSTSPPVVTEDYVIIGGAVNDNVSTREPSGAIRAYDVRSGELVWNWDPANPESTAPLAKGETYSHNSPNSWSISSVDETLGLIYLPMGNQVPDQWGSNRNPDAAPFSSAIVALELDTGKVRWVFQTVHNDLWDMDVPAQPSLIDLHTDNGTVPALVAPTKQGDVYVLDRRNGEPVLPVSEKPAPESLGYQDVAATQPASSLTLNPPPLRGRDMWGATLFDQLFCRIQFQRLHYQGRYTPPSETGSLIYPGNFGVFNWGGLAVDPERQVAFATPSYLAFVSTLIPRQDDSSNYVSDGKPGLNENYGAPYAVSLKPFLSPLGLPCQQPPWGYVAGLDLRSGKVAWMHRNGTVRDQSPVPLPFKMGVPDLGGPVVTAGGVAFMSGTLDYYVRAYDLTSGEPLWEDRLPAGGQATPMTYQDSQGRQRLLVVAGGHGSLGTKAGDAVIVYGLKED